jgi:two-component system, OmpR family, sensor kinase
VSDRKAASVRAPRAIRILLSAASLLVLVLVIGLGAFSLQRLSDVNRVSDEIRNQWLQDIRLTGDLNNFMSDYRTAEGTHLLSNTSQELDASERDIAELDAQVARAQRSYEALSNDAAEREVYEEFSREWSRYKVIAAQVLALSHLGAKSDANIMYMTASRRAFDKASDALGHLTDQTVERAREASKRAAGTYLQDRRLIVTAMVVATLLVLATIIYIIRWVSRPLLGLAQSMRMLASHNTGINISGTSRDDEIGEMARSIVVFRDNAIALANSQRRLVEQTAALEETLEKERRVTAQQRNFVTMTSHEFRTPLTVIDAQAQRLIKLKDRLAPQDVLERGTRIRSAVTRLTGIMDSLLGDSRLLDGEEVYRPCAVSPAVLLNDVCQLHRDTTRTADIRLRLEEMPTVIYADPKLLFALFSNLLSNALKYSGPGDPVEITALLEPHGNLLVRVRDHGIGIAEYDRAHLFERYFRGSNAVGIAGSGVGLHLVAMVLHMHGGSIELERSDDGGASFAVRLPVTAPDAIEAETAVPNTP